MQNGTEVLITTENHPELGQKTTVDENGLKYTLFFYKNKVYKNVYTQIVKKKLRTILDFKVSLFLNLTYVLKENYQGLFYPIGFKKTL